MTAVPDLTAKATLANLEETVEQPSANGNEAEAAVIQTHRRPGPRLKTDRRRWNGAEL
jgi:hypothetical protein